MSGDGCVPRHLYQTGNTFSRSVSPLCLWLCFLLAGTVAIAGGLSLEHLEPLSMSNGLSKVKKSKVFKTLNQEEDGYSGRAGSHGYAYRQRHVMGASTPLAVGSSGAVPSRISCTVSHLYPAPLHEVTTIMHKTGTINRLQPHMSGLCTILLAKFRERSSTHSGE